MKRYWLLFISLRSFNTLVKTYLILYMQYILPTTWCIMSIWNNRRFRWRRLWIRIRWRGFDDDWRNSNYRRRNYNHNTTNNNYSCNNYYNSYNYSRTNNTAASILLYTSTVRRNNPVNNTASHHRRNHWWTRIRRIHYNNNTFVYINRFKTSTSNLNWPAKEWLIKFLSPSSQYSNGTRSSCYT